MGASLGFSSFMTRNKKRNHDEGMETFSQVAGVAGGTSLGFLVFCEIAGPRSNRAYDVDIEKALIRLCAHNQCKLKKEEVKHFWDSKPFLDWKVTYPDGFTISFTHDPSVIEVKTAPITSAEMQKNLNRLDQDVFELLRGVGLSIPKFDGPWNGGHLHIGIRKSFADVRHFRNFLVDLYDHPELGQGILLDDPLEGRAMVDDSLRIQKAIRNLDELLAKDVNLGWDSYPRIEEILEKGLSSKRSISFNKKFGTLELRFIRSQRDASTVSKLMRLFDARIVVTGKFKDLKPFVKKGYFKKSRPDRIAAFRNFVEEGGLSWAEMETLVPSHKTMRVNDRVSGCLRYFQLFR